MFYLTSHNGCLEHLWETVDRIEKFKIDFLFEVLRSIKAIVLFYLEEFYFIKRLQSTFLLL